MKIVLAGGTGFVGAALEMALSRDGHELVLLTRRPREAAFKNGRAKAVFWDGRSPGDWTAELSGADAVVNFSGEPIAARWTGERKKRIAASRIESTRALVSAMRSARGPRVLINASGTGFYGDAPGAEADESRPAGAGFLAETCRLWEAEALEAGRDGTRVVLLRMGVVLGPGGGALERMAPVFRFFAGGPLGSGRQWFPWVHRDDVIGAVRFALERGSLDGPVNVAAPEAVRMEEFCRALGTILGRPSWLRVPAPVLRLVLGEMAETLLTGAKALPRKLLESGYAFRYARLEPAIAACFGRS